MSKKVVEKIKNEIFISGLPYEATEEEIREFFKDCGTITNVKLPKYQDTGRLLGYGHLTFETEEEALEALSKTGQYIGSRYVEVKLARDPQSSHQPRDKSMKKSVPEGCRTIFVKGLPYSMTEDELGDSFKNCGKIENVRIAYNSVTKQSKGFGYVDFQKTESVEKALEMDGKEIGGRIVIVDAEEGKAKAGYRYNMEESNAKYSKQKQEILKKKIKKETKETKKYVKIKDVNKQAKEEKKKIKLF